MNKEEILDQFFKDELTMEEIKKFRDQGVITDSDIESFNHLISALEKKDNEDTRQYLRNLETQDTPPRSKNVRLYVLLALLTILLLVGYFLLNRTQPANEKIDIAKYAYLYPSEENSRSIDTLSNSESDIIIQAKAYYANSEFARFIDYYEGNKGTLSKMESFQLQFVSSLVALKNYDKALLTVQNDIVCESKNCTQNLEWYYMISLIGTDLIDASKQVLQDIQKNPDHIFFDDSKRLLEELNR